MCSRKDTISGTQTRGSAVPLNEVYRTEDSRGQHCSKIALNFNRLLQWFKGIRDHFPGDP